MQWKLTLNGPVPAQSSQARHCWRTPSPSTEGTIDQEQHAWHGGTTGSGPAALYRRLQAAGEKALGY